MAERYSVEDLLTMMQRLRDPIDGCPWDRQQTLDSIVPYTLEECYELADTITSGDYDHLKEELGDVLFQVVFYSQITTEKHDFGFNDVVHTLVAKLVKRHPHVFPAGTLASRADDTVLETAEINASWEAIKQQERKKKQKTGLLADIPVAFPSLVRAQKLQKRAASVGFDWSEIAAVKAKIDEEFAELAQAMANNDEANICEEAGDVLFSMVNMVRHLGLDAETVLRQASAKFESRFIIVEQLASDAGRELSDMASAEMEALWVEAKLRGQL
ncbi:MAG: ATP diphosphatase [Chitinophagales bacterium]|jgi:ATP diphosphatase